MKAFLITLCLTASIFASPLNEWQEFKKQHNKEYREGDEEEHRMKVFFKNKKMVDEHNAKFSLGLVTFRLMMNHLGDLETHEVSQILSSVNKGGVSGRKGEIYYRTPPGAVIPDRMDWREWGAVSPVKDQRKCGSCWAFSTTGVLESQVYLRTGKRVILSEQNLLDCSKKYDNDGCIGGTTFHSFQYIMDNHGIDTESSYPYTANVRECRFNSSNVGATVKGYIRIPYADEEALKSAVATVGPISINIDANHSTFHLYHDGIYYDPECSATQLDHLVLAVGYGTEGGKDYWMVKNSWGAAWGDQGYLKMARNRNNHCGVVSHSYYPLV